MSRATRRIQPQRGLKKQQSIARTETDSASEPPETIAETGSRRTQSNEPIEVTEPVQTLFSHLPSEQEVRQAQTLIFQYEREYEGVQAEYKVKKLELDALAHRISTMQSRIFEKKASIAVIRRVPQDVLSIIFSLCVREDAVSPWTLMHVCRNWRAAAMYTPALWNRIMIAPSNWAGKRKGGPKFFEGMEVCSSTDQLERAVKQAGSTPLELRLFIGSTTARRWAWAFSGDYETDFSNQELEVHCLLDHLCDLNLKIPVRALEIDTGERYTIPRRYMNFITWTDVERLVLDGEYPMILSDVIESGGRNLKVLKVDYADLAENIDTIPWVQLKELGVTNVSEAFETPCLIDALQRCRNVTTLSLKDVRVGDSDVAGHTVIDMLQVTRLTLGLVSPFWPINCPNLTHLSLPNFYRALAIQKIRLPHLIWLASNGSILSGLNLFDAPELRTFEWTCRSGKADTTSGIRELWLHQKPIVIDPVVVNIRDMSLNSKCFAQSLSRLNRLEQLHVTRTTLGADFFDTLAPTTVATKRKGNVESQATIPMSDLKEIVIDLMGCKKSDDASLTQAGKSFIVRREELGVPMERLDIRTLDGTWHDLVTLVLTEREDRASEPTG